MKRYSFYENGSLIHKITKNSKLKFVKLMLMLKTSPNAITRVIVSCWSMLGLLVVMVGRHRQIRGSGVVASCREGEGNYRMPWSRLC